jgi:hypothetical protein
MEETSMETGLKTPKRLMNFDGIRGAMSQQTEYFITTGLKNINPRRMLTSLNHGHCR